MLPEREMLAFEADDGEIRYFYVEEETRVAGISYLLVTDSDEQETNAYILKDLSADGEEMSNYVMVEDDEEFGAIAQIFEQMTEDEIEKE